MVQVIIVNINYLNNGDNMIIEEKVTIKNDISIGATISYLDKNKKSPLILLIMGTGTTDRDGNIKNFKTDFYKNLSDIFVKNGYVCIRYDKRGTHESTGNYKTAGLFDLVNDSANVIDYAKNLKYVDKNKIIVCGHSEGAMIATLLTKIRNINGLILLGGACTCMKSALIYQNCLVLDKFENKKGLLAWYIRKILTKEKINKQFNDLFEKASKSSKERYFFNGGLFNTKYMKEHGSLTNADFINILKAYNGNILAITGTSDLSADYTTLNEISDLKNATIYTPQNVNHILREIDDDNDIMKAKKQYKRLCKNPIHKETLDKILKWLNEF